MSFIYSMLDTWNNVGITFNSIYMNTSNGAGGAPVGAAASRLLRLDANSTSVFDVDVSGTTYIANRLGIGTQSPSVAFDLRGAAIFNEAGADFDVRMEGDTESNLFFLDASTDRIGIGTASPSSRFSVTGNTLLTGNLAFDAYSRTLIWPGIQGNFVCGPTSDGFNTWLGIAGNFTLTGTENVAIGYTVMNALTTGLANVAIGGGANLACTTGNRNVAIGRHALRSNISGNDNVAIGEFALDISGTAGTYNFNTAVGSNSLAVVTSDYNTALGYLALNRIGATGGNVGVGALTLKGGPLTGGFNTAVGYSCASVITSGARNFFGGSDAGTSVTTGSNNVQIGFRAGYDCTTGSYNLFLGSFDTTGVHITTGSNNIFIGKDVYNSITRTGSNQLNIGNLIFGTTIGSGTTLSTGRIGIGVSPTASSRFSVVSTTEGQGIFSGWAVAGGASNFNGQIHIGNSAGTDARIIYDNLQLYIDNQWDNAAAKITFRIRTSGTPVTPLTLNGDGTATFGAGPTINDAATAQMKLDGWSSVGGAGAGNGELWVGANTSFNGVISYSGGNMYIENTYDNAAGNILIKTRINGTAVEAIKFIGAGGIVINEGGIDADVRMEGDTEQNLFFLDASTDRIGIGTASPSAQVHTTGSFRMANFGAGAATFDASGNISSVSDERYKNIVSKFGAGLDQLLKIQPILYKWNKDSGMETEHIYAGFSAQNVQRAIPEAVGINSVGLLSLQDRALLAVVVNSVKELANKVTKLEA